MSGKGPWVFTSPTSAGLTVTMGEKGSVSFRDGVARVTDEEQAEELRTWMEANPGYGVYEGEPKVEKETRLSTESASPKSG